MAENNNKGYENFFEAFYKVKQFCNDNPTVYGKTYQLFIDELEAYLYSFNWAKDNADRALFLRAGKNLTINEIAEEVYMNPSALRFRLSTKTHRLCEMFFDGKPLDCELLSSDEDTIMTYTKRLLTARINFKYFKEYDKAITAKIDEKLKQTHTNPSYTDRDVYDVILVLARYSKRSIDDHFKNLNPDAVKYVYDEMLKGDPSITVMLYDRIVNQVAKYITPNEKRYEQMQHYVDKAKETYSDGQTN